MKVGLVDVDGRAKHRRFSAFYPNYALCKIARYHKERGDNVEWALPFTQYDIIYMSKVFNWTPDDMTMYFAKKIIKGGTGYDIKSQLPNDIDRLQPDYSIYPNFPSDTAYGFLTRGCPNTCPWCVVPHKEGKIRTYMDCEEIAIDGRKKLILMDNNILAAGEYAKNQLSKIIKNGYRIDFNQALDARLVNKEFAKLLAKIKWIDNRIRFGCDTPAQIKQCERAISLIVENGFHGEFFLYTMLNDDMEECFTRVNYWWKRNKENRQIHEKFWFSPYAQPYRDPNNPNRVIPMWQKDMAQWCNKHQYFCSTSFFDFSPRKGEYGRDYFTKEFIKKWDTPSIKKNENEGKYLFL